MAAETPEQLMGWLDSVTGQQPAGAGGEQPAAVQYYPEELMDFVSSMGQGDVQPPGATAAEPVSADAALPQPAEAPSPAPAVMRDPEPLVLAKASDRWRNNVLDLQRAGLFEGQRYELLPSYKTYRAAPGSVPIPGLEELTVGPPKHQDWWEQAAEFFPPAAIGNELAQKGLDVVDPQGVPRSNLDLGTPGGRVKAFVELNPFLRPAVRGAEAVTGEVRGDELPLVRAGQILSTLQRPYAAMARAAVENHLGSLNEAAKAQGKDEPYRNPDTGEPYKAKPFSHVALDVLEATSPIPQTRRADVSYRDVLQGAAQAAGGTGHEWWVGLGGLGLDIVADPANALGVTIPAKTTKLARLQKLEPILRGALETLAPDLQRLFTAGAENAPEMVERSTFLQKMLGASVGPAAAPLVPGATTVSGAWAAMTGASSRRASNRLRGLIDQSIAKTGGHDKAVLEAPAQTFSDLEFSLRREAEAATTAVSHQALTQRADVAEQTAGRLRALNKRLDAPTISIGVPLSRTILRRPMQEDLVDLDNVSEFGNELRYNLHKTLRHELLTGVTNTPNAMMPHRYEQAFQVLDDLGRQADYANRRMQGKISIYEKTARRSEKDLDAITDAYDLPLAKSATAVDWKVPTPRDASLAVDEQDRIVQLAARARASAIREGKDAPGAVNLWRTEGLAHMVDQLPDEQLPDLLDELMRKREAISKQVERTGDVIGGQAKRTGAYVDRLSQSADEQAERILLKGQVRLEATLAYLGGKVDAAVAGKSKSVDAGLLAGQKRATDTLLRSVGQVSDVLAREEARVGRLARRGGKTAGKDVSRAQTTVDQAVAETAPAGSALPPQSAQQLTETEVSQWRAAKVLTDLQRRIEGRFDELADRLKTSSSGTFDRAADAQTKGAQQVLAGLDDARSRVGATMKDLRERIARLESSAASDITDRSMDQAGKLKAASKARGAAQSGAMGSLARSLDHAMDVLNRRVAHTATWREEGRLTRAEGRHAARLDMLQDLVSQGEKDLEGHWREYRAAMAKLDDGQQVILNHAKAYFHRLADERKAAGIIDEEIDGWLPHIYRNQDNIMRAVNPFTSYGLGAGRDLGAHRTVDSLDEAKSMGLDPITNILHAMAAETWAHNMAVKKYEAQRAMVKRWGTLIKPGDMPLARKDPEGYQRFVQRYRKFSADGKEHWVPIEVAAAVEQVQRMWTPERLQGIAAALSWLATLGPTLGYWKKKATVGNFGFHARNAFSDLAQMTIGGWTGKHMRTAFVAAMMGHLENEEARQAGRAMRSTNRTIPQRAGDRIGQMTEGMRRRLLGWLESRADHALEDVHGNRYTLRELYQHGVREYAVDHGWAAVDVHREGTRLAVEGKGYGLWRWNAKRFLKYYRENLSGLNPLGSNHYIMRLMDKGGRFRENLFRLTYYIDRVLEHGDTPKAAAQQTAKALYDYSDLTKADRTIKKLIPFWTWTRKNVPRMFELAVKNPSTISIPGKVKRSLDRSLRSSVDQRERMLQKDWPKFLRQKMAMGNPLGHWPLTKEEMRAGRGDGQENLLLWNPDMPQTDFNLLPYQGDFEPLLGMLTPILKTPIEMAMGRQLNDRGTPFGMVEMPDWAEKMGLGEFLQKQLGKGWVEYRGDRNGQFHYLVPEQAMYLLRQFQPDWMQWESLLWPQKTPELAARQKLRRIALGGASRFQVVNPEQQTAGVLNDAVRKTKEHTDVIERRYPLQDFGQRGAP